MRAIVVHGGAGTILPKHLTKELETAYLKALRTAVKAGDKILAQGGTALSAVEKAVIVLENSPLFNAGKGSVFGANGKHEMDASIMCGLTKKAGAVAGVRRVKNPISLASAVMHKSEHVLLAGSGAEDFGKLHGVRMEDESYFYSEHRYNQWQKVRGMDTAFLDHNVDISDKKFGTVGAVALDNEGNVAAATSTGGLTNKKYGRVGDSPLIGIGNYANNDTCAVSCTGDGEYFIRGVVAYDISALMEFKGLSVDEASKEVILKRIKKIGGEGGVIAIDSQGNIALPFNSTGMYRGYSRNGEEAVVKIFD